MTPSFILNSAQARTTGPQLPTELLRLVEAGVSALPPLKLVDRLSDKPIFRAEPLLAHGTANPITVRILLQFAEILDAGFAKISTEKRAFIKVSLFTLMQDLHVSSYDCLAVAVWHRRT